jgi:hypothetical protein
MRVTTRRKVKVMMMNSQTVQQRAQELAHKRVNRVTHRGRAQTVVNEMSQLGLTDEIIHLAFVDSIREGAPGLMSDEALAKRLEKIPAVVAWRRYYLAMVDAIREDLMPPPLEEPVPADELNEEELRQQMADELKQIEVERRLTEREELDGE